MRSLITILVCFLNFQALGDDKVSAEQLEGLSDCDYFKYTECTSANLNIGSCVKKKYQGFVKACGKVHADKFLYSREMYKPKKKASSKNISCDKAQTELCDKNGLSIEECSSKYKKEMSKACGEDFLKAAADTKEITECFKLRKKYCGDEMTLECDEIFQAKAPAHCKSPVVSGKKGKDGAFSDKQMLSNCQDTILKSCKMPSDEELLKEGSDPRELMKKYQVCVQRSLKKGKGKCGGMFPDVEKSVKDANK